MPAAVASVRLVSFFFSRLDCRIWCCSAVTSFVVYDFKMSKVHGRNILERLSKMIGLAIFDSSPMIGLVKRLLCNKQSYCYD